MKKLALAFVIAAAVILILTLIDLHNYKADGHLRFALKHHGGEITIENGLALSAVHTYGMTPEDRDSHSLRFAPVAMVISLIVLTAAVFGLINLGALIFKKK